MKYPDADFASMVEEEWETWKGKGDEYTIGLDRLYNFTSIAEKLGLTPAQVWATYFMKHVHSALSWAKTGEGGMEGIESRLLDIAVYAKLGRLIARMENKPAPTPAAPALSLVPDDRQPRPAWTSEQNKEFFDELRRLADGQRKRDEVRSMKGPIDLTPSIMYRDGNKESGGSEYVADAWQVPLTAGDRYDI